MVYVVKILNLKVVHLHPMNHTKNYIVTVEILCFNVFFSSYKQMVLLSAVHSFKCFMYIMPTDQLTLL